MKNAQEAHEAIRPTTPLRSPQQVGNELNGHELALYRLIWQRTLASQMADATGHTVTVRIGATADDGRDAEFSASGTTITFPGYRQVYVEARDEGDDATTAIERDELLPQLAAGEIVDVDSLEPRGHATTAPPRYTEASLVKRLEELGIGRPSTWASIIQTIQDRGYVWKKGQALVPTWTAFAVVGLLEQHFDELVDYAFTAKVETDLDAIAAGQQKKDEWLHEFYFGDDPASDDALPGLKRLVEENLDSIDAAAINTFPIGHDADGNLVVVKPGRFGPYVKRGDDTAGVPDDLPPDELTIDVALSLLAAPKADEPIGELDGPAGVRQERSLRPVRAARHAGRSATGSRQAEDGEPVQVDVARAPDDGRRRSAAQPAPHARQRPGRRRTGPRPQRSPRSVRAEGQGVPLARHARSASSPSPSTRRWRCWPPRRSTNGAPATWPPAARCASSVTTRSALVRSSPGTDGSGCTSPTARPTPRSGAATASRR